MSRARRAESPTPFQTPVSPADRSAPGSRSPVQPPALWSASFRRPPLSPLFSVPPGRSRPCGCQASKQLVLGRFWAALQTNIEFAGFSPIVDVLAVELDFDSETVDT